MRCLFGIVFVCAIGSALLIGCSKSGGAAASGGSAGMAGSGGSAGTGGVAGSAGFATGGAGGTMETFDPLQGIGTVELVADGFMFTEGPTWRSAEQRLLFTDIPANAIHQLTPPDDVSVFVADSGQANGLDSDLDGLLLAAEHANRRVSRTLGNGTVVTVVSEYMGDRLNSPNDIAVRSDGTIYFTDPPYGIDPNTEQELEFNGVFRVAPDGQLTAEWEGPKSSRPNGLVLSPDESVLYVADTMAGVMVFDVNADGSLSNERDFIATLPNADGMAIDTGGNLFITTSTGVQVFDPAGNSWGTIEVPDGRAPANCAFGGDDARTLYITARQALYRVSLVRPGLY